MKVNKSKKKSAPSLGQTDQKMKQWRNLAAALVLILTALMITDGVLLAVTDRAQGEKQAQNGTSESVEVAGTEQNAVALSRTSSTMEAQSDGTTKFITLDENSDGTSFRRVITNSNRTNLAADTREPFIILEIIPDYTFTYFSWLVGGCEPVSEDMLYYLSNCGSGDVELVFGRSDSTERGLYAITRVADGDMLLDLGDYSSYDPGKGKNANGWLRVIDSSVDATESGYFKYVGGGKGLYSLSNFQYKYRAVAEGTGRYQPNVDFYVTKDTPEGEWDRYTGADYDLYYTGTFGNAWNRMYAYSASLTPLGTYAQRTVAHEVEGVTVNFPYYEHIGAWNGVGTDPYADVRCMPNFTSQMRNDVDGHNVYGNQYGYQLDTEHVSYHPGNGQYKAKLQNIGGDYYTLVTSGNYDSVITNATSMTGNLNEVSAAGTSENVTSYSGDYVWVAFTEEEAANMPNTLRSDYIENPETTNIYLKNYSRTYAYYSRNGYVNNEFFKILCLDVSNQLDANKNDGENYYAITSEENSAYLNSCMEDFDSEYRIEIRCVSPDQVTNADLESASLIYAGEDTPYDGGVGAGGLSKLWCDREGMTQRGEYTRDLPDFGMAMKIYENAIINTSQPRPFMYSASLAKTGEATRLGNASNLYKLFMLFNVFVEQEDMRQFIPRLQTETSFAGYLNYIDEATGNLMIHYKNGMKAPNSVYLAADQITDYTWVATPGWEREDFQLWADGSKHYSDIYGRYEINYATFGNGVDNIEDGDHSLMYHWYTRGFVMSGSSGVKIYKLLTGWNRKMTVTITNAVQDASGKSIIYVDEFDGDYPVEFTVVSTKDVDNVKIYLDMNGNGNVDPSDTQVGTVYNLSEIATGYNTLAGNPIYRYEIGTSFGTASTRNVIVLAEDVEGLTGKDNAQMIVRVIPDLN